MKTAPFFTIAEAARFLDVSRTSIYTWLDDGALQKTATVGGLRMISEASVLALKECRDKEGKS